MPNPDSERKFEALKRSLDRDVNGQLKDFKDAIGQGSELCRNCIQSGRKG
jgi:hypothetical protein